MINVKRSAPLSVEEIRRKIIELAPKYVRINYSGLAREIGITPQLCRYHWMAYCSKKVINDTYLEHGKSYSEGEAVSS